MSRRIQMALLLAALLLVFAYSFAAAQDMSKVFGPPVTAGEAKIRAALDTTTTAEFIETPLQTITEYLQDLHGIQILVDDKSLNEEGISNDSPLTLHVKGITLRSLLSLMLRDVNLTWTIQDEVLLITTKHYAAQHPARRVYDVADLMAGGVSADDLTRTLRHALAAPDVQPAAGGSASGAGGGVYGSLERASSTGPRITAFQHLLIVLGSESQHQQLSELLDMLRTALAASAPETPPPLPQE